MATSKHARSLLTRHAERVSGRVLAMWSVRAVRCGARHVNATPHFARTYRVRLVLLSR